MRKTILLALFCGLWANSFHTATGQINLSSVVNTMRQTTRVFQRRAPDTVSNREMERLLKEIDWLEHRLDTHGSVVAQQASVWGESRLTKTSTRGRT